MCGNIGKYDRFLRVVIGAILLVVAFNNYVSGALNYALYFIAVILLLTGIIGWCGLYTLLSISTKSNEIDKITRKDIEMAVKNSPVQVSEEASSVAAPTTTVVVKKSSAKKSVVKKSSTKKSSKKKVTKKSTKKAVKK